MKPHNHTDNQNRELRIRPALSGCVFLVTSAFAAWLAFEMSHIGSTSAIWDVCVSVALAVAWSIILMSAGFVFLVLGSGGGRGK